MLRPLYSGYSVLFLMSLLTLLLLGTSYANAASPTPRAGLAGIVKDEAWAQLLGQTLFWDTIEIVSDSPATEQVFAPTQGPGGSGPASLTAQAVQTLLAHRPLEKYVWLIQRAFEESVWKGTGTIQVRQNFALIWRVSIMLYESKLNSNAVRLRVCQPDDRGEDFDCSDQIAPAIVVPIPSHIPLFGLQDQPVTG